MSSSPQVSVLSFGSWVTFSYQVDEVEKAKHLISTAFHDYNINFFDNAEVYAHGESERIFGQALKELDIPRHDIVISTKLYFGATKEPSVTAKGLSRKHIIEGMKASLSRLQLEYVDVVFCHRPDPETPIEETVRAMNWLIDQGFAFYWGTSEWSAAQITEACETAQALGLIKPCCEQPQYNLLHRRKVEEEYEELYEKYGLGLTIWSPLASGLLSGKYGSLLSSSSNGGGGDENDEKESNTIDIKSNNKDSSLKDTRFGLDRYSFLADRYLTKDNIAAVEKLRPLAEKHNCTIAQLSLAWCIGNERVSTVITGASRVEQLHENVAALGVFHKLSQEDVEEIGNAFTARLE